MLDTIRTMGLLALTLSACGPAPFPGGSYTTGEETSVTSTTGAETEDSTSSSSSGGLTKQVTTNNGGGSEGDICTDYETCVTEATLKYNGCDAQCLVTYGQDLSCIKFACESKCGVDLVVEQLACGETYPECAARPSDLLRCRLQCMFDSETCFAPPHCPADDADPSVCQANQKACLDTCNEA